MNKFDLLSEKIEAVENTEDAWSIQNLINDNIANNNLTEQQGHELHNRLLSETQFRDFDLNSTDDVTWESMKRSNPNLSEQ